MPDKLTIEPAMPADLTTVHDIEQISFPAPWRIEFFASELLAKGRFNVVAKRNGVVIGYLFSMWIFEELHVNKIAVVPEERRRGIADALMDRCFDFAREHEVELITLEVRQSNKGAQDFYRHLDFQDSYVRPRYYPDGEAAVVMTREM
ncbi:MAG TPA: ribosomal protein S18-alanine N-acetyltransferase [Thermoanaerobaculia bacterium]|nr:ribosomal protein S18-alanine N-acetyltransferase [Thermoanaerobaculia bacterium]